MVSSSRHLIELFLPGALVQYPCEPMWEHSSKISGKESGCVVEVSNTLWTLNWKNANIFECFSKYKYHSWLSSFPSTSICYNQKHMVFCSATYIYVISCLLHASPRRHPSQRNASVVIAADPQRQSHAVSSCVLHMCKAKCLHPIFLPFFVVPV